MVKNPGWDRGDHHRKRIGVALGGGVVRGMAHVGVLSVLKEANIPIDIVSGTSAGAIVAACFCSGMESSPIERVCLEIYLVAAPTSCLARTRVWLALLV